MPAFTTATATVLSGRMTDSCPKTTSQNAGILNKPAFLSTDHVSQFLTFASDRQLYLSMVSP